MQIWPWWAKVPHAPTEAAAATSTSPRTISAELPPSSRCARLRCCPASAPTARPARVEPVNAMIRTAGSTTIASPTSAPPGSTCSTPAGSPASSNTRANIAPPEIAVRGSGLRITALPSASAGATARMARIVGTLNGAITPTTPAGTRRAKDNRGDPVRSSSPYGCDGSADGLVALLRAGVHLEVPERLDRPGLPRQPALDLVTVGLEHLARPAQHPRPLLERQRRPRPLRLDRPHRRGVHVLRRRLADRGDHLTRRRLHRVIRAAGTVGPRPGPDLALPDAVLEQCHVVSLVPLRRTSCGPSHCRVGQCGIVRAGLMTPLRRTR